MEHLRGPKSWEIPDSLPLTDEESESLENFIEYLNQKLEQGSKPSLDDEEMKSYLDIASRDFKREITITLDSSSSRNGTQQNTSTPSDVKFVAEPDKSLSSCEGPAVEDSTPSTSYGQGAIPWSNMELDWNFVDEGIDSDGLSWMTETSDIEKLAKKAALLQPSRNEQQVLKHINYKESRMSEALERFHGRLKNLDISTLTELKFLVVYMSTNSQICVHRQQSQNTIPVICRQLNTIAVFIGWFVTNGPIFDFNQCKRMVAERVALRGDKFDLPKTICGILRRNSHVTEADVKILGRLFDKPTYNTAAALDHLDPRKSPYDYMPLFLDRVYEWFESEYANFMRRQQYRNA